MNNEFSVRCDLQVQFKFCEILCQIDLHHHRHHHHFVNDFDIQRSKCSYNARSDWLKQRALSENRARVNYIKLAFKFFTSEL